MKKVSQKLVGQGYDVEHHHCSGNPNFLDGLVVPALNTAVIDGTAPPHAVDARQTGCIDEIVNLGQFWDESKLIENQAAILSCTKEINSRFQRACRILKAAKAVYDNWEVTNGEAMNYKILNNKILNN
ncbi:hypothetical protein SCACP_22820 [Sporomusa carbonis]|uniref:hypothetical protein n=1 Tax=Sporomusa carbonis TaxID=3076075 RepID=UPI003A6697FA